MHFSPALYVLRVLGTCDRASLARRILFFRFFVEYALVPRVFRIENNGEILREKWRSSQVSHSRFESGRFSEIENNGEILRLLALQICKTSE